MRAAVSFVVVVAAGLLVASLAQADEPAATEAVRPADPATLASPDLGVPATQPLSLPPARPWFFTLASAQRLYQSQASATTMPDYISLAAGSMLAVERDEMALLAALGNLRQGRVRPAAVRLASLARASTPHVARAAGRYDYVLRFYPDGKVDDVSLADFATFQAACKELASEEAGKGDILIGEVERVSPLSVEDWEQAWSLLGKARIPFEAAALLDETIPANRAEKLKSAEKKLAETGIRLIQLKADQQREELIKDTKDLR